jgi:tRNA pseudouridine38-40 synthase
MYHHRLIVSYKGTSYFGWQDLGSDQEKPTLESTINQVLKIICKYEHCTIATASRTDAGVHAQGQVIKISIPIEITSEKLLLGMNSLLPDDIRILQCQSCPAAFNPNINAISKEYHYYFCTDIIHNPVLNDSIAHITLHVKDPTAQALDIELMQKACKLFIGEHDFYSFAKRDSTMDSTFRTIYNCEIIQASSSPFGNNIYYIKIIGKGFLRYMVRYISGALFALGKKQLTLDEISQALVHHKEEKISSKAKSKGLHLIEICY